MRKFTALLFALLFLLAACKPPAEFSGAKEPTPYTFALTEADIAKAESDDCAQAWVTGDSPADVEAAFAVLDDLRVKIKRGTNPIATGTALRNTLWVDRDLFDKDLDYQVQLLSHELVHYCDREKDGDVDFDARYFHSAGRWVYETRAYAQSVRTMKIQRQDDGVIQLWIDRRVASMRDKYWLHDIDPAQYLTETRRILEAAAE